MPKNKRPNLTPIDRIVRDLVRVHKGLQHLPAYKNGIMHTVKEPHLMSATLSPRKLLLSTIRKIQKLEK